MATGDHTIASGDYQTVMGRYNSESVGYNNLLIVGNGYRESDAVRKCIKSVPALFGPLGGGGDICIKYEYTSAVDRRSNAFVVGSDGKLYSNGNYPISDVRLKENIKPIDGALAKVLKLQGVYYD